MATSAQTKNARSDDQHDGDGRARPDGHRSDGPTAQVVEPAREAAAETTEMLQGILRQSQDTAQRSVTMWTEMMTGLNPFTVLHPLAPPGSRAGNERADDDAPAEVAAFPARAWSDGVFEMFETALATQRRGVDQVLAAQRRLVGQLLEAGAGLAAAPQAAVPRDLTSARSSGS